MNTFNIQLFGIPVIGYDLNLDNSSLISYSYKLKEKNTGRYISNEGGWQSNNLNVQDSELQPLFKNLKDPILSFAEYCGFKKNLTYKLNNVWININGYKDYNNTHIHPGCLFSVVYYVKTPKNCGELMFSNPSVQILYDWKEEFMEKLNNMNCFKWSLPVKEGKLYIFPSWVWHYVKPNLNKNEDRISMAFNVTL
jgi:uncharacterized protein (TIGR02466 family)